MNLRIRKVKFFVFCFLFFSKKVGFPITLNEIKENALKKESLQEVVQVFEDSLEKVKSTEEKTILLEKIAELYSRDRKPKQAAEAYQKAYNESKEDIYLLYAARCLLEDGNSAEADLILDKIIRSKDKNTRINAKFYRIWSSLIEISQLEEMEPIIRKLKSYLAQDEMEEKRASILFLLWYITKDENYQNRLKKEYSSSMETALSLSKISLPPSPFWLFMPQKEKKSESTENKKRRQLGLFKNKKNALSFISCLKNKGFDAYIIEEVRKSGITYFIIVVDEKPNQKIEAALRKAGYESYPLE